MWDVFAKFVFFFSLTKYGSMEYLKGSYSISNTQVMSFVAQGSPAQKFLDQPVAQGSPNHTLLRGPPITRCPLHAKNRKTEKPKTHWKHTENILKTHYNTKKIFFALRAKQSIFTKNTPKTHWKHIKHTLNIHQKHTKNVPKTHWKHTITLKKMLSRCARKKSFNTLKTD